MLSEDSKDKLLSVCIYMYVYIVIITACDSLFSQF